jgi:hypothetical protein
VSGLPKEPGFWLVMYLFAAFTVAVNVSVNHRVACDSLNDLNAVRRGCLPGSAVIVGAAAGLFWPFYGAHEALYAARGGR